MSNRRPIFRYPTAVTWHLVVIGLLVFGQHSSAFAPPETKVSGTVRDALGRAVADARLQLSDGVSTWRAATDASGRYEIGVTKGQYSVSVFYPEHQAGEPPESARALPAFRIAGLEVGDQEIGLSFPPTAGVTLDLELIDEQRNFVPGLQLLIWKSRTAESDASPLIVRCSQWCQDGAGRRYRVAGLAAGEYSMLLLENRGYTFGPYRASQLAFTLRGENTRLEIPLRTPSAVVAGRVQGPGGQPISGARVVLGNNADILRDGSPGGLSTSTSADGGFALPQVAPGRYWAACQIPGSAALGLGNPDAWGTRHGGPFYFYAWGGITVTEQPNTLQLTIPEMSADSAASLSGRVSSGAERNPVESARVVLWKGPGEGILGETVVASGPYLIDAGADEQADPQGPVPVVRRTDRFGLFTLEKLPPGKYEILIIPPGEPALGRYLEVTLEPGQSRHIAVELPPAGEMAPASGELDNVRGQALRPLGLIVQAINRDNGLAAVGHILGTGQFSLGSVPPGNYELVVTDTSPLTIVPLQSPTSAVTFSEQQPRAVLSIR